MRRDRNMPRALLKPRRARAHLSRGARAAAGARDCSSPPRIPGRPVKVMDDLIQVLELLRDTHHFTRLHPREDSAPAPRRRRSSGSRRSRRASRSISRRRAASTLTRDRAGEESTTTTLTTLQRARSLVVHGQQLEADGWKRNPLRPGGASGMTTQFVVGATTDSDRTIVERVSELYAGGGIHHVHFSAFRPIRDTPLETRAAAPALREHRLYQTDYLLRYYGFETRDLVYRRRRQSAADRDPKVAWALSHPEHFPVDVAHRVVPTRRARARASAC